MWNPFASRPDPLKTRREEVSRRREMALLDLMDKEADLLEDWGKRSLDYELQFNQAFRPSLDARRTKFAASASDLQSQITSVRQLVAYNPFAKSAISNIEHYVLGEHGMRFRVVDPSPSSKLPDKVNTLWQTWAKQNDVIGAQSEILRRLYRDGGSLLRWFSGTDGTLEFRFIEPEQLRSEGRGDTQNPGNAWGLQVDPTDPVKRLGYWVKYDLNTNDPAVVPELVPVEECDWLPAPETDRNVMRPSPPLYGALPFLEGAAGVIRNMRELVRVQTAIAIIREHPEGMTGSMIAAWQQSEAAARPTDGDTDKTINQERWHPGTVLDVQQGEKVHFPAAQMQVDRMVSAVQADLRAVAASIGLPEFIFSADASSSNYASLMAAEGPAVKTFESLQGYLARFLDKMFHRFLVQATTSGIQYTDPTGKVIREKLPTKVLKLHRSITAPSVRTGKMFEEARVASIEAQAGVLSPQQWCASRNRDYGETMAQIAEHRDAYPELAWPPQKGNQKEEDKTGSETRNAGDAE